MIVVGAFLLGLSLGIYATLALCFIRRADRDED